MAGKTEVRETGIVPVEHTQLTAALVAQYADRGQKISIVGMDGEEMSSAITARKAVAETAEELLQPLQLIAPKDNDAVLGRPFRLVGVGVRNSDDAYLSDDGGLGIYVVLNTTLGPIGTGAKDIVVTALRLVEINALPQWCQITQTVSKSTGRKVLNLTGVPAELIPEEPC